MTHEEARERLLDLAYGELGPDERERVETHVAGCAACSAELLAMTGTRAAARLPDPGPPAGREALVEAARRAVARPAPRRRGSWARPAAAMAVAALVLVVGGVTFRWFEGSPRREGAGEEVAAIAPVERAAERAKAPETSPLPQAEAPSPPAVAAAPAARPPSPKSAKAPAAAPVPSAPADGAMASRRMADAKAEGLASGASPRPGKASEPSPFPPGTSGAFASLDLRSGASFRVNPAGCATRYSPFSTFKVPASLVALQTGVVKDADEAWPWDPSRYPPPSPAPSPEYVRAWQRDQSLRTALQGSIVWFFREAATRVGETRMKEWLAAFGYGNQDLSGGVDRFWLGSSLRISPDEQVAFLARLQRGELPVARKNLELVQDVLAQEAGPGWRLVAKTGSSADGEGWLVGWVEARGGGCAFALHLNASSYAEMARVRPGLARDLLRQSGCLPP